MSFLPLIWTTYSNYHMNKVFSKNAAISPKRKGLKKDPSNENNFYSLNNPYTEKRNFPIEFGILKIISDTLERVYP